MPYNFDSTGNEFLLDEDEELAELNQQFPDDDEEGVDYEEGCADDDFDESMDGDFDSGMASAGYGTDEDYNHYDYGNDE